MVSRWDNWFSPRPLSSDLPLFPTSFQRSSRSPQIPLHSPHKLFGIPVNLCFLRQTIGGWNHGFGCLILTALQFRPIPSSLNAADSSEEGASTEGFQKAHVTENSQRSPKLPSELSHHGVQPDHSKKRTEQKNPQNCASLQDQPEDRTRGGWSASRRVARTVSSQKKGPGQIPWPHPCLPKPGDLRFLSREDRAILRIVIGLASLSYRLLVSITTSPSYLPNRPILSNKGQLDQSISPRYCWLTSSL
jgi:hypothetical protein